MFGEKVREIRKQKGLSINKLSKISGVSLGYLSDLENNKTNNPSLETLNKIAEGLEVPLESLVSKDTVNIDSIISDGILDQELMWAYLIKSAESDSSIKKTLDQALNKDKSTLKLSSIVLDFMDNEKGVTTAIKYDFENNSVSRYDELAEKEKRKINSKIEDKTLGNEEILTLAAHMFGHEGPLTEEVKDKIALAMKIALAKNDK